MTIPEAKSAIAIQLNTLSINTLVDNLAAALVEIDTLKAKLAELQQDRAPEVPAFQTTD